MTTKSPRYPLMTSLFDIQINGFGGVDFQQAALNLTDLRKAVAALAARV